MELNRHPPLLLLQISIAYTINIRAWYYHPPRHIQASQYEATNPSMTTVNLSGHVMHEG